MSSDTKRKAALASKELKKTGGGVSDAPSLTPAEERVVGLMGKVNYEGTLTLSSPINVRYNSVMFG